MLRETLIVIAAFKKSFCKGGVFYSQGPDESTNYECFLLASFPLDSMARIFLSSWIRKITQFIVSGSILFLLEEKRKTIWSELEFNPGPLVSQATTLTT